MLVVCEQCHTKYVVPDEKVVKSVLRLPCQKCGHVITMRVEENKEQTPKPSSSTLGKWRSTSLNTPRKLQSESPAWYYSYNGESHGPFTEQELKDKLLDDSMSEIATQCYIWRKTFKEWKPVLEVEPFASALLMPPPPPPKQPAKAHDENLPPLFSGTKGLSETNSKQPVGSSSPDLLRLKHRLQNTDSEGSFSASQRESLAKLATSSSLFGKVEKDAQKQNDVPTHTQIPAIDNAPSEESEDEDVGDTTRVAQLSPLSSFQDLEAIISSPSIENRSEDIPSQQETTKIKDVLQIKEESQAPEETTKIKDVSQIKEAASTEEEKPKEESSESSPSSPNKIPSISSLSVKAASSDHKTVAPFGGLPKPGQGISSLFGQKSPTGNAQKTPSFGGLKSFSALNSAKSAKSTGLPPSSKLPSTSFSTPFGSTSTLNSSKPATLLPNKPQNPSAASTNEKLIDAKEDIGDILKSKSSTSDPVSRDDSVSSWLPSQSDLNADANLDEILLGDITMDHEVIDYASASESLPSFELDKSKQSEDIPDLDLENPESGNKSNSGTSETAQESSDSTKQATISSNSASLNSLPSIDVSSPNSLNSLPSIDVSSPNSLNSLPSIDVSSPNSLNSLPSIDVSRPNSLNSLPSIDVSKPNSLNSLPSIDVSKPNNSLPGSKSASSGEALPDIDIDEDSMQLTPNEVEDATQLETPAIDNDKDDQNVLSAFESLSKQNDEFQKSRTKSETELSELGAIDLDDESSQQFSEPEIKSITNEPEPKKSGIVEYDMLFDDVPAESEKSVARASHSRLSLDEIAAQHKALFEESEKLEQQREDESSVSESSMLIQLNHFQKITEQDKRKSKVKVLAIVIPTALIFILLASGVWFATNQNNDETVAQSGFATVKGREISSDDLNQL
ncbi:MAG: zinc-ribbon domain-containing protein, partial [Proteobacteria bacterium]|nr:zinc-ribbon domain-containing protein [Pseudomonadota bacterium]